MKKRLFALALIMLILCAAPVSALSAEPTGSITASYSGGMVTFSGVVTGGVKAVAVLLFNPNGSQLAMTTCAVTNEGTFSGSISINLTSYGVYAVKAADYEGGAFFAEDTFNRTASPPPPSPPSSATAEEIGGDESDAAEGENEEKPEVDEEDSIRVTDVSNEYQQTHPGRRVFSVTVDSSDGANTNSDGSVTVSLPYELNEGEAAENVTVWRLTASGVRVPISCTYDPATNQVSFAVRHSSRYMVGIASPWENPFADVSENDLFKDDIRFVQENGLMAGTGDNAFSPRATTSRGMIVAILHRLEGAPATGANTFSDVAADKYYAAAVVWAAENRIVGGYGDGKFGPEDAITREQLAVILRNYAIFKGYYVPMSTDLSKYKDEGSISSWARDALDWANAAGLIQGDGTNLMPKGNAERCQVAAILQRFFRNISK